MGDNDKMISTVTTTVTTITTTVWSGSFAFLATITLLTLLIKKEVISVAPEGGWQRLNRALTVAIVPLMLTFLAITVMEVIKLL